MSLTPDAPYAPYREPPWSLHAEWTVEEADLHAAQKELPGATLALVRWPIASFVAMGAIEAADPKVGAPFALVATGIIAAGWISLRMASRGTDLRKIARLPEPERATRLSVDETGVRHETASGHAAEFPLSDVGAAKFGARGALLLVRGMTFFVPARAVRGDEAKWRAFAERFSGKKWPTRLGFTAVLWSLAAAVAIYSFVK